MDQAKRVCFFSGVFQLAAGISFLSLPLFQRVILNYPADYIGGWQMIAGYVVKMDVLERAEDAMGISLLLLFLGSCILVLVCAAGTVTSWIPRVPPVVSAILSLAGIAAGAVLYEYAGRGIPESGFEFWRFWYISPGCLAAAAVIGFVSAGMRVCAKKKETQQTGHEKLPGLSEQMEHKKYYQIVEKEPAAGPEKKQEEKPLRPYTPGSAPRGVMVGLTGVYAGEEIPLRPGETIRVGRDVESNLVFDKRAPRVSRHHCEITWNPESQNYSIVDTSTNGTFKNGSEDCLPQNMTIVLEVGCTLSLGSDDNVFRLE